MSTLKIIINCGEMTCASSPGKFCEYLGARKFGQQPVCLLFPELNPAPGDPGGVTVLEQTEGWLQRLPACLEAEKREGL